MKRESVLEVQPGLKTFWLELWAWTCSYIYVIQVVHLINDQTFSNKSNLPKFLFFIFTQCTSQICFNVRNTMVPNQGWQWDCIYLIHFLLCTGLYISFIFSLNFSHCSSQLINLNQSLAIIWLILICICQSMINQ